MVVPYTRIYFYVGRHLANFGTIVSVRLFLAKNVPATFSTMITAAKIAVMAMFNIAFGTVPNDGPNWKHHPHTLLYRYLVWAVIS